jgi:3-oxoacyl-[acyl-carrier-protein] synthase III
MIGIENIASYIPQEFISNYDRKEKFGIDDYFIEEKIGVKRVSVKAVNEDTSDLCVKAWKALLAKQIVNTENIECLVVVTQNPDSNIPHVSAKVHGGLELPESCACFDISLGCSGFVHGLSVVESFMERNGFKKGLLFTADPYSKIINPEDKNTSMLFGDGAAVTLLGNDPVWISKKYNFGTIGKLNHELICTDTELRMNGRAIFDFAARYIPRDIYSLLEKIQMPLEKIDVFLFHQGSKYILNTITKRLKIDKQKVPFMVADYGNTVSSSIPIMLENYLQKDDVKNIVISGFGVGLAWASTVLERIK